MKTVGLIDYDSKIINHSIMQLSTYFKGKGYKVRLNDYNADYLFLSTIFTWNKDEVKKLKDKYPDMEVGGTGWDFEEIDGKLVQVHHTVLPPEVAACKPDYDLYTVDDMYKRIKGVMTKATRLEKARTLVDAGIGATSLGCIRACGFCIVNQKEGMFRQHTPIADIINPRSNVIILLDNNFTADPLFFDKVQEIKERKLVVDITQGIDVRLMTPEKAKALSEIKLLRSLHYAWDLMSTEKQVVEGIKMLSERVRPYKHLCFTLVGYNTTFEEDMYRFQKLRDMHVDPYVMIYNCDKSDLRLMHFARWVNGRVYKQCKFDDYTRWAKVKESYAL